MKQAADSCATVQELLLDYAYGELEAEPRRAVQAHVEGCESCRTALAQLSGTRAAMAALPQEPAPQAGLESLLAYAEQAAKSRASQASPSSVLWRWLVPALGLASASAVALLFVAHPGDPSRGLAPAAAPIAQTETARPAAEPVAVAAQPALAQATAPAPAEPKPEAPRPDLGKAEPSLDSVAAEEKAALRDAVAKSAGPARKLSRSEGSEGGEKGADFFAGKGEAPVAKDQKMAQALGTGGIAEGEADQDQAAEKRTASSKEDGAGRAGGGQASGSPHYANALAQTPVWGAVPRDDQESAPAADRSRTAGLMSNAEPLGGAEAKALPAKRPAQSEVQAPAAAAPAPPAAYAASAASAGDQKPAANAPAAVALSAQDLLRKGADQASNGDLVGAEATYAAFLAQYPAHPKAAEVALWRVELLEKLGRTGDAAVARAEYARRWPTVAPGGAAASGPRAAPASPARMAPMEKAKSADSADEAVHAH